MYSWVSGSFGVFKVRSEVLEFFLMRFLRWVARFCLVSGCFLELYFERYSVDSAGVGFG